MRLSAAVVVALTVLARATTAQVADSASIAFASGAETAAARAVARVLQRPHVVINGGGQPVDLPRSVTYSTSVVVISPRVTVGATVDGDVAVIGGDLFVHPRARIAGDAIAVGGGVYPSSLATIAGGQFSFRDETFDATRSGNTIALAHRTTRVEYARGWISWPLGVGARIPSYNRIDGVVLPWGPVLSLGRGAITIDPTLTYRSDLGNIEPAVRATLTRGNLEIAADARRSTFSNDKWIRGDLLNSAMTLLFGRDARNYYRADRVELTVGTRVHVGDAAIEPFVGAVHEKGWSSGAELSANSHPFAVFGKDSIDGIYRPNPQVNEGTIRSGVAGAEVRWSPEDVSTTWKLRYEQAWEAPGSAGPLAAGTPAPDEEFRQLTADVRVGFPTFRNQSVRIHLHAVRSWADFAPPVQRWAYVGGSGTVPTMDLLEEGGPQLFFAAADYVIPVPIVEIPFLGSPVVTLRYIAGGAGMRWMPDLTQNIGVRVGLRFIGLQFLIDPESKEKKLGIGLTLSF